MLWSFLGIVTLYAWFEAILASSRWLDPLLQLYPWAFAVLPALAGVVHKSFGVFVISTLLTLSLHLAAWSLLFWLLR